MSRVRVRCPSSGGSLPPTESTREKREPPAERGPTRADRNRGRSDRSGAAVPDQCLLKLLRRQGMRYSSMKRKKLELLLIDRVKHKSQPFRKCSKVDSSPSSSDEELRDSENDEEPRGLVSVLVDTLRRFVGSLFLFFWFSGESKPRLEEGPEEVKVFEQRTFLSPNEKGGKSKILKTN